MKNRFEISRIFFWDQFDSRVLIAFWLVFALSPAQASAPQSIVLQGTILTPSGLPQEASSVVFTVEIGSPGAENCLMYSEAHTLNMTNSGGAFSLPIGTGTRSGTGFQATSTLSQVFDNAADEIMGLTCASGTSYDPLASHSRKISITFNDGSGPQTLTQTLNVQSVPYALYADSAKTLGPLGPEDFLQTKILTGLTQSNVDSVFATNANVTELLALINGTSSQYAKSAGAQTFSGNVSLTGAGTGLSVTNNATIGGTTTIGGVTTVTNTTSSTNATTGAVVVGGGLGVAENINSGGAVNATTTMSAGSSLTTPIIYGSNTASGTLTLHSTSDVTKGNILINPDGGNVGIGTVAPSAQLQINTSATGTIAQIIKWGQAGQTANLLEFQDNSGTILSRIDKDGKFYGDGSGLTNVSGIISGLTTGKLPTAGSATSLVDSQITDNGVSGVNFANSKIQFAGQTVLHNAGDEANIFVGRGAGNPAMTGTSNTAVGMWNLASNSTGAQNTAMGREALTDNQTGNGNSAFGFEALYSNQTGSANTGVGLDALRLNVGGNYNTAVGNRSLRASTGSSNTAVGYNAGLNNTGSNNTLIGYGASAAAGISNATALGHNASVTSSNSLVLGNGVNVGIGTSAPVTKLHVAGDVAVVGGGTANGLILFGTSKLSGLDAGGNAAAMLWYDVASTSTVIGNYSEAMRIAASGNVGIGVTGPTSKLQVAGDITPDTTATQNLGSSSLRWNNIYLSNAPDVSSDARLKKDVQTSDLGLDFINSLRPVSWTWKDSSQGTTQHYGVIAQETESAIAKAKGSNSSNVIVTHNEETDSYSVRYTELISPLIKAIQELYNDLLAVKAVNDTQDREIASVKAENAQIKAKAESEKVAKDSEIKKLKQENAAIKAYLCAKDPKAAICK